MNQTGTRNEDHGVEAIGLDGTGRVFWNLGEAALLERAVARAEGRLSDTGALVAATAPPAAPGPDDRYIVRDAASEDGVWWDGVNALERDRFERLKADMLAHAGGRTLFAQDLHAGTGPGRRVNVRVLSEHAWHALFVRNMLFRPEAAELLGFVPELTILCTPGFRAEPETHGVRSSTVVAVDLARGLVLIAGTLHAGEITASLFAWLAHALPDRGLLPLAGAASVGAAGDVAVFLGRPGTGTTALAADPARTLIADGAHIWSADGIGAVAGGSHARTRGLSPDAAPALYAAVRRFGSVMENVALDPDSRAPDFDDAAPAGDARAAFPLSFLAGARAEGNAGAPKHIFLLAGDAFGVLPPIARLTPAQALYHYLSGYGATPEGTEAGGEMPRATFCAGGAPAVLPRHPSVYGGLLRDLLARHAPSCWLVNTGWIGGRAGIGQRVPLALTRRLVEAALSGALDGAEFRTDPNFGFAVPTGIEGVDPRLLDPARNWPTRIDYSMTARRLVGLFSANFARFEKAVDEEVRAAQPGLAIAAE